MCGILILATMVATTKTGRSPLPPVYFFIAIIAMVAVHWLVPVGRFLSWPWRLTGALPILLGLGLAIVAERQFKRAGTAVKPFEPSSALVTDGVFRFSRNPMYLGMVLVLLGLGVALGNAISFVVVPVFAWLIAVRFIGPEEKLMAEQFGDAYEAYRSKVRRWL
jgi:protein-S-isoprenylcysteine O-methyltransferase Ste14